MHNMFTKIVAALLFTSISSPISQITSAAKLATEASAETQQLRQRNKSPLKKRDESNLKKRDESNAKYFKKFDQFTGTIATVPSRKKFFIATLFFALNFAFATCFMYTIENLMHSFPSLPTATKIVNDTVWGLIYPLQIGYLLWNLISPSEKSSFIMNRTCTAHCKSSLASLAYIGIWALGTPATAVFCVLPMYWFYKNLKDIEEARYFVDSTFDDSKQFKELAVEIADSERTDKQKLKAIQNAKATVSGKSSFSQKLSRKFNGANGIYLAWMRGALIWTLYQALLIENPVYLLPDEYNNNYSIFYKANSSPSHQTIPS